MNKPRILVTTQMMIHNQPRFLKWLNDVGFDVDFVMNDQFLNEKECLNLPPIYDGWIAGDDQITSSVIDHLTPKLKIISKWGTGIDSIDKKYTEKKNVIVKNTFGAFKDTVSEIAVAYLLSLSRGLFDTHHKVINGYWPKIQYTELVDSNVGIIGLGAIGEGVAKRLENFRSNIFYSDPVVKNKSYKKVSFEKILTISDYLIFTCDLNSSTFHMLNMKNINNLKKGSFIINVGRGSIISEEALIYGFDAGLIAGAGLDVFEIEPLSFNNKLKKYNVIFGSHNANNTRIAVENVHKNTINNLCNFFNIMERDC